MQDCVSLREELFYFIFKIAILFQAFGFCAPPGWGYFRRDQYHSKFERLLGPSNDRAFAQHGEFFKPMAISILDIGNGVHSRICALSNLGN